MICPQCEGTGEVTALFLIREGKPTIPSAKMPCERCDTQGTVSDKTPEWIKQGEKLKAKRMGKDRSDYMNHRKYAELLGVEIVELSKAERGVIDPQPIMNKVGLVE